MSKIAIDNDILAKVVAYGLVQELLATLGMPPNSIGVLRTLVFSISEKRLKSAYDGGTLAHNRLRAIVQQLETLEPTQNETLLAILLEETAQNAGLDLDVGESQLVAIAVSRNYEAFYTGDKRAIAALEQLRRKLAPLAALDGRVIPMEILTDSMINSVGYKLVRARVCGSTDTDKALEICFQCHNIEGEETITRIGLASYIRKIQSEAPILCQRRA